MADDELSNTLAPQHDDGAPEPELQRDHVELQRARLQLETAKAEMELAELRRRFAKPAPASGPANGSRPSPDSIGLACLVAAAPLVLISICVVLAILLAPGSPPPLAPLAPVPALVPPAPTAISLFAAANPDLTTDPAIRERFSRLIAEESGDIHTIEDVTTEALERAAARLRAELESERERARRAAIPRWGVGATPEQVRELAGDPERVTIDSSRRVTWYYPGESWVLFFPQDRVVAWRDPRGDLGAEMPFGR